MVDKKRLLELLPKLRGRRVVVLGDLFLDEYIVGRATRLSREAPIPVLEFTRRFHLPGGGANPAHNIRSLGGFAQQVGVIGQDQAGEKLLRSLEEIGIDTGGVVVDPSRTTTTKMRVVAEGALVFPQQVARIDRLDPKPVERAVEGKMISYLEASISQADAVLLSDYRSGVVTERIVAASLDLAHEFRKLITVDSQGDLHKYRHFDLVKCNRREAEAVLGHPLEGEKDFQRAGEDFLEELGIGAILITRGDEGMSLARRDGLYLHVPAANLSEVFDVTGAGDTVIAVATLAMAAGIGVVEAAYLANYVAGLVVRKLGNATATQEELAWAVEHW